MITKQNNGAALNFESQLWAAADRLCGRMDTSEYKHMVLGLIFLKYISDSFEEVHAQLFKTKDADPEGRDECLAQNVFWVPKETRWSFLQTKTKQPEIAKYLDDGMIAIECDNPTLKNNLPMAQQIRANIMQMRTLGNLRASLLSKLMRGEVRVKEVEEVLP